MAGPIYVECDVCGNGHRRIPVEVEPELQALAAARAVIEEHAEAIGSAAFLERCRAHLHTFDAPKSVAFTRALVALVDAIEGRET